MFNPIRLRTERSDIEGRVAFSVSVYGGADTQDEDADSGMYTLCCFDIPYESALKFAEELRKQVLDSKKADLKDQLEELDREAAKQRL